jgi:hypothetical protein
MAMTAAFDVRKSRRPSLEAGLLLGGLTLLLAIGTHCLSFWGEPFRKSRALASRPESVYANLSDDLRYAHTNTSHASHLNAFA